MNGEITARPADFPNRAAHAPQPAWKGAFPQPRKMKTLKIGLTGGMGCGKSAAGAIFRELGLEVLDADALARRALSENPKVRAGLSEIFGGRAFLPDGSPNRPEIARMAFSDREKLAALEAAVHPAVREAWTQRAREIQNASGGGFSALAVEIPLLFEKGLEKRFDICITVFCSEATRLGRLRKRGMSPKEIGARDAFQLPPLEKVRLASVALFNEGDLDFLRRQAALTLLNLKNRWTKTP